MKGLFIPEITAEMFRSASLEGIEALMVEGEFYDIEHEPERKTGKWSIEFSPAYMGGAYCECSQCNYKFAVGAYIDPDEWDYCPKCGSTMTEGEAV